MYDSSAYIWTLWSLIAFVYCSFFRHSFSQLFLKKKGGKKLCNENYLPSDLRRKQWRQLHLLQRLNNSVSLHQICDQSCIFWEILLHLQLNSHSPPIEN
ncbi:hypothetical protein I7I53_00381 [Histoplasma capsulatum var. duboisii H88]|uniref:Uncharacterized protein n=1 Tax=Ajellomyces capsulatus (strain H88) TaxID=544711 RepID=A0A8A1LH35_AJEC8|nr:hypothetical protein I7I53_00381 [Histoplasma capsulatum var. duboisii H88]